MSIGNARTGKFRIGTVEVRIGPLSSAMRLMPVNSIGIVDEATLNYSTEQASMMQGFPQNMVDEAITSEEITISATLREFSRRNLNLLLGHGIVSSATDVSTTVATEASADATSVDVDSISDFEEGDLIVAYPINKPGQVTVARVASAATGTITLSTETPLLHTLPVGSLVFKSGAVSLGSVKQTQYFAVELVEVQRGTSRPMPSEFWKCSLQGGSDMGTNVSDFASSDLQLRVLEPLITDYDTGGPLAHLSDIIPDHPKGIIAPGLD